MSSPLVCRWPIRSGHNQSAVHVDGLAGDVIGVFTGEKCHQPGHVLAGAGAFHGDLVLDPVIHQLARGIVAQHLAPDLVVIVPHVAVDDTRTDRIDGDVFQRHLFGEALSDPDGAVRRMRTRIRLQAQPEPMRSIVGAIQQEQRFD